MHPSVNPDFATELLAPAGFDDDKYTRGTVGFVTGSEKYPGAALLGINSAYELGIGMVRYLGPQSVSNLVLSNRPETVLGLERAAALVVGSGVADDDSGEQVENLAASVSLGLPMVIDAGAMQLIDLGSVKTPALITPHHAEAVRLLNKLGEDWTKEEIANEAEEAATTLAAKTGLAVLLKANVSHLAIPGFEPIQSGPGSTHLATAGTGDVLAGMIGTLMAKAAAKNIELTLGSIAEIALIANQLHSEAAEWAAERGQFGASAVCDAISSVVAG